MKGKARETGDTRNTDGPSLRDFIVQQQQRDQQRDGVLWPHTSTAAAGGQNEAAAAVPYLSESDLHGGGRRGDYMYP